MNKQIIILFCCQCMQHRQPSNIFEGSNSLILSCDFIRKIFISNVFFGKHIAKIGYDILKKTMFSSSLSRIVCMRVHVLPMSYVLICSQWYQALLEYTSNMASILSEAGAACPFGAPGRVRVLLIFLIFCVLFLFFVCHCHLFCVYNVASVSAQSIIICLFCFL